MQASLTPTRVELLTPSDALHRRQLKRDLPYDSLKLKLLAALSAGPLSDQPGRRPKEQRTMILEVSPQDGVTAGSSWHWVYNYARDKEHSGNEPQVG